MKLRISDRILAVLVAILFLLCASAIVAESVFGAAVSVKLSAFLRETGALRTVIRILVIVLCLVIAWLCLRITFRRFNRIDMDFVEQKTEGGQLRVSVKAIDGLVRKCVMNHDEMVLKDVRLLNGREGLSVVILVSTAADISIPLAVSALQKQLHTYVLESTGVDIHDIQVDVDDAQAELAGGTYRLHDSVIDPEECCHIAPSTEAEKTIEEPAGISVTEPEADDSPVCEPADDEPAPETLAKDAPAVADEEPAEENSGEEASVDVEETADAAEDVTPAAESIADDIPVLEEDDPGEHTVNPHRTGEAADEENDQPEGTDDASEESPAPAAPFVLPVEEAHEDEQEKPKGLGRFFHRH